MKYNVFKLQVTYNYPDPYDADSRVKQIRKIKNDYLEQIFNLLQI